MRRGILLYSGYHIVCMDFKWILIIIVILAILGFAYYGYTHAWFGLI